MQKQTNSQHEKLSKSGRQATVSHCPGCRQWRWAQGLRLAPMLASSTSADQWLVARNLLSFSKLKLEDSPAESPITVGGFFLIFFPFPTMGGLARGGSFREPLNCFLHLEGVATKLILGLVWEDRTMTLFLDKALNP